MIPVAISTEADGVEEFVNDLIDAAIFIQGNIYTAQALPLFGDGPGASRAHYIEVADRLSSQYAGRAKGGTMIFTADNKSQPTPNPKWHNLSEVQPDKGQLCWWWHAGWSKGGEPFSGTCASIAQTDLACGHDWFWAPVAVPWPPLPQEQHIDEGAYRAWLLELLPHEQPSLLTVWHAALRWERARREGK